MILVIDETSAPYVGNYSKPSRTWNLCSGVLRLVSVHRNNVARPEVTIMTLMLPVRLDCVWMEHQYVPHAILTEKRIGCAAISLTRTPWLTDGLCRRWHGFNQYRWTVALWSNVIRYRPTGALWWLVGGIRLWFLCVISDVVCVY